MNIIIYINKCKRQYGGRYTVNRTCDTREQKCVLKIENLWKSESETF